MELSLIELVREGGWIALFAFLFFILLRLEKRIESFEQKLEEIQKENIRREEYYRDISGWRGEIQRLDDKLTRIFDKFMEVRK